MNIRDIIKTLIDNYSLDEDVEGTFYVGKTYFETPTFVTTEKEKLTNKQKEYLEIYNEFYKKNGRYATYKEMGEIMGVYQSVAFDVIKKIKQKHYIK